MSTLVFAAKWLQEKYISLLILLPHLSFMLYGFDCCEARYTIHPQLLIVMVLAVPKITMCTNLTGKPFHAFTESMGGGGGGGTCFSV